MRSGSKDKDSLATTPSLDSFPGCSPVSNSSSASNTPSLRWKSSTSSANTLPGREKDGKRCQEPFLGAFLMHGPIILWPPIYPDTFFNSVMFPFSLLLFVPSCVFRGDHCCPLTSISFQQLRHSRLSAPDNTRLECLENFAVIGVGRVPEDGLRVFVNTQPPAVGVFCQGGL